MPMITNSHVVLIIKGKEFTVDGEDKAGAFMREEKSSFHNIAARLEGAGPMFGDKTDDENRTIDGAGPGFHTQ